METQRILFQNDACMVINKRSGESSESPEIREKTDEGKYLVPIHRLDMPVTGCLLLAREKEAAAFLSAAFARHDTTVEKRYWAIIETPQDNSVLHEEGELVHWIHENRKMNKSFARSDVSSQEGKKRPMHQGSLKKAVLRYRVIGTGKQYLFLEIDLITGRRHQIRAQLAALGLHIKGDLKYGAHRSEKQGGIRLHAYSLAFPNPISQAETIRVTAPPPMMDNLWTAFTASVPLM